jgi:hypothetical protein
MTTYKTMVMCAVKDSASDENHKTGTSLHYIKAYMTTNYNYNDSKAQYLKKALTTLSTGENPQLIRATDVNGDEYHKYTLSDAVVKRNEFKATFPNNGKKWLPEEDEQLLNPAGIPLAQYLNTATFADISRIHLRTEKAVKIRAIMLLGEDNDLNIEI